MAAKKTKLEKPDIHYLLRLRAEMEARYKEQDEQIDASRATRENKQPVVIPKEVQYTNVVVRNPQIADEAFQTTAVLSVNPPKLTITPNRESDSDQENATKREKATQAILREAARRTPGLPTDVAIVDATANDGGGWSKFLFYRDLWDVAYAMGQERQKNPDLYPDDEAFVKTFDKAKKKAGSPFVWVKVDARSVYPIYSGIKLLEVLEISKRPLSTTFRQYRLTSDAKGNIRRLPEELGPGRPDNNQQKAPSEVVFLEHWTEDTCTYAVVGKNAEGDDTGEVVDQFEHPYKKPPYFSSLGLQMSHWVERKVGWSISETKRPLVEYDSFLMTVHANVIARDAALPLFWETDAQTPSDPKLLRGEDGTHHDEKDRRYELGIIYDMPRGKHLATPQFPQTAERIASERQQVHLSLDKMSTPNVTSLNGMEGAGFAIGEALSWVKLRYGPLEDSIGQHFEDVTRFLWDLITEIDEEVFVYVGEDGKDGYMSLGPEDLQRGVQVSWEIDTEQPSAKLVEERYWGERLQQGTANKDMAIEKMGDNPDEVRIGQLVDEMRAEPEIKSFFKGKVLQSFGRGDVLVQAEQAAQAAQTGEVGDVAPGQQAMGSPGIPDVGQLAASPGGGGMTPAAPPPQSGSVQGAPSMAPVPQQAAMAGASIP